MLNSPASIVQLRDSDTFKSKKKTLGASQEQAVFIRKTVNCRHVQTDIAGQIVYGRIFQGRAVPEPGEYPLNMVKHNICSVD